MLHAAQVERDAQYGRLGLDEGLKHLGPSLFSVAMIAIVMAIAFNPFHPASQSSTGPNSNNGSHGSNPNPIPTPGETNQTVNDGGTVSFTTVSGIVVFTPIPAAKNGSYVITFTASTVQVYATILVFTPSPYPNNSNYWW